MMADVVLKAEGQVRASEGSSIVGLGWLASAPLGGNLLLCLDTLGKIRGA